MTQTRQNEQITKIGNWIAARLNNIEDYLVIIFLIGLVVKQSINHGGGIIVTLSLSALAVAYYLNFFSLPIDEHAGGMERFVDKIASVGCSVGIVGIQFRLNCWPGYDTMIICGCGALIICLPVMIVLKSKKPELKLFSNRVLIRTFIIGALGLALNFTSNAGLIKYKLIKEVTIERVK